MKKNKKIIVVIIILALLLVGETGYIIYDKFFVESKTKTIQKIQEPQKEETEINKIDENTVKQLHSSLITNNKVYGLYFKEGNTIDKIPAKKFIPYVIYNYAEEKNLTTNDSISKEEIDQYIKTKYNTERVFDLSQEDNNSIVELSIGAQWDKDYEERDFDLIQYDTSTKEYLLKKSTSDTFDFIRMYNNLLKYELDNNNLYIYDNALVCFQGFYETNTCAPFWDYYEEKDKDKKVVEYNPTDTNSDIVKDNKELNEEYIFKNLSDKLYTYKHTFKKDKSGNYYWYSSEIIK